MKLTDDFLKNEPADPDKRQEFRDDKEPGLIFRISEKGARTWSVRYRNAAGEHRRKSLGSFPAIGLSKALRRSGITVNAIAPGLVESRLTKITTGDPDRLSKRLEGIPAGRLGTPDDMAGAALFLASPLASYIVGQTIVVDGGRML